MDPFGEPLSATEKFQGGLVVRMRELMSKVHFGAAADCFDPAFWKKPTPTSESLVLLPGKSASDAVDALIAYQVQLPQHVDLESAKLDCVEIIEVARWMAERDVIGKQAFDHKYGGAMFKLDAPGSTGVVGKGLAVRAGSSGDGEYNMDGTPTTAKLFIKAGIGKGTVVDLTEHLAQLPIGSRVMWRNFDPGVPRDDDFKNENTIKIGDDLYAAHPVGVFSLAKMAQQVATGGYEDMPQVIKDVTEKLATATEKVSKLDDPGGKDKKRLGILNRRIRRYTRMLAGYGGIGDQATYVDRFIRVVETETFVVPCG